MKHLDIANNITRSFNKFGLQLKKHSPEILIVVGIAGAITSAVMACKATTKVPSVIENHKKVINDIKDCKADADAGVIQNDVYNDEDYKKDLAIAYTHTGIELFKLYAPAVGLGVLSIASILASSNIMRKRNVALAAAYTVVDKGFKEYRDRVVDRFGKELDRELKYNIKAVEVEETVTDENGKEKTVKNTIKVTDSNEISDYARFFDDGCTGWDKDSEYNLMFLRHQQNYANELLRCKGYLFLNDVYDMLGIPRTKAGQMVGWIYDENRPNGDNYIDFGIYDVNKPKNMDFVNGYERSILLDFNVDGNILDLI